MSTMTVTQPTTGLSLCSVTFTSSPLPGGRTIARFEQPGHYLACASPVSGDPLHNTHAPAEGFLLLTLNPANQAAGAKQAEAWMQAGGSSSNTVLRQSVDGGWVLYCPGRAVICAPENVAQDIQVALADPLNQPMVDELGFLLHKEIVPLVADPKDIEAAITRFYGEAQSDVSEVLKELGSSDEIAREVAAAEAAGLAKATAESTDALTELRDYANRLPGVFKFSNATY